MESIGKKKITHIIHLLVGLTQPFSLQPKLKHQKCHLQLGQGVIAGIAYNSRFVFIWLIVQLYLKLSHLFIICPPAPSSIYLQYCTSRDMAVPSSPCLFLTITCIVVLKMAIIPFFLSKQIKFCWFQTGFNKLRIHYMVTGHTHFETDCQFIRPLKCLNPRHS